MASSFFSICLSSFFFLLRVIGFSGSDLMGCYVMLCYGLSNSQYVHLTGLL